MTNTEKIIAAKFLEEASNAFSYHGCNDVSSEFYEGISKEEVEKLTTDYNHWNSTDRYDDCEPYHVPDFALMSFLAHKLKQELGRPENGQKG